MASLFGFREAYGGESLLLYKKNRSEFYVEHNGEKKKVDIKYNMVRSGTFNQDVQEIPYIVVDNDVYPIDSFKDFGRG